jgi:transglutaminase-like putative cysteine protease
MRALVRPLPRAATQVFSVLVLVSWVAVMGALVRHSYSTAAAGTLATDLARYGTAASWRGVYYRGEKIGFTVGQTIPDGDGFRLEEDGRLQMAMLGATTAATIRTTAHVDSAFTLRAFEFSLDPGTGPTQVRGRFAGRTLTLEVTTRAGTRTEQRELDETPALSLNLSRRLASGGLATGRRHQWTVFDPATLRNAPVTVDVGRRELVRGAGTAPIPAFRVEMAFGGLRTTSWVTDTGEVVREESPLGVMTVRESPEQARNLAVSPRTQADLLESAAIVPRMSSRIDEPRDVRRLRVRLRGLNAAALPRADLDGGAQHATGEVVELIDPRELQPQAADRPSPRLTAPEPLIESDAPEIRTEAERAVAGADSDRMRAERLTRYVNALLDKKPTVSLPSAREVLRTKVGDCNEHTALYVAMARAVGVPARIAVGLVYVHGAFFYHAWPEVYVDRSASAGTWLPVDPTLNQFPADATHLRLVRGGLEQQAAVLPLIGHLSIDVERLEMAPDSTPIVVGRAPVDLGALAIPIPRRETACCVCRK